MGLDFDFRHSKVPKTHFLVFSAIQKKNNNVMTKPQIKLMRFQENFASKWPRLVHRHIALWVDVDVLDTVDNLKC